MEKDFFSVCAYVFVYRHAHIFYAFSKCKKIFCYAFSCLWNCHTGSTSLILTYLVDLLTCSCSSSFSNKIQFLSDSFTLHFKNRLMQRNKSAETVAGDGTEHMQYVRLLHIDIHIYKNVHLILTQFYWKEITAYDRFDRSCEG